MASTRIVSSQDGVRVTLADLMKAPTVLPTRMLKMTDNEFLVDAVLQKGDPAPSGVVLFWESTPLYTEDDPEVVDEFGMIPVTNGLRGTPKVVRTVRRAFGLRISKTMRDRNQVKAVLDQMTQLSNTMVRAWEDALFSAFVANASINTLVTDTPWGASGSHIRRDVNAGKYVIKNAAADTAGRQKFGYKADTLIISTESEEDFLNSDEVSLPYVGNIADQNIKYTGLLPNKFLGLDVMTSWRMSVYIPSGAIIMQRSLSGTISDERPLEATPLYGEGGGPNGGPTESWRSDMTRQSSIAVEHPKSVCIITGVTDGETFPIGDGDTVTVTTG